MTGSSTTTTTEGSSDRGLPPRVATAIAAATDAVGRFGPANAETIAARLRKHAETAPAATTVVVVGETKRGRSTLVNALLDYPGLSPVQATGSSSTYVIVHAGPDTVDPHAVVVGEAGSEEITIGELPERLAADTGGVVDVFLPAPSLEGVVLVDTPGANGVGARRGNLTRRLATESGLVLFTIDAGSPISRPEVDLLSRLARDVELIAVVVTMSDKYAGSIDAVASATRSHLARESARLARLPIMAVSALAYEHAARLPGGEYRTLLESASGVPALRAQLAALTARAPLLRGANVLRSTRSLLTGFARVQELSLSVGESQTDPTPHDLLEQLRELQERRTRWPATLERDLSRLRRSVVTTVVAALREIHRQTEADLARIPLRDRAGYLTEVGSRLTDSVGDVFGDAGEHLRDGLGAIVDRATDGQVRVDDIVDLPPLALPDDWVPELRQPRRRKPRAGEMLHMGGAAALSVVGVAGASILFLPFVAMLRQSGAESASERARHLTLLITRAREQIVNGVESTITEARPELLWSVQGSMKAREAALADAVRAARAGQVDDGGADRKKARATLREITEAITAIDDALALLRS